MGSQKFSITINKAEKQILTIKDFGFEKGKINFLLGESGIGKTIISKCIFGILESDKFQITVNDKNYDEYLKTIDHIKNGFFVFQEPSSHFNPLLKIGTQLKEGNLGTGKNEHALLKQLWQKSAKEQFLPLLKLYPKPYRPSGGEKQRFLLIMALKKIDLYLQNKDISLPLFIFDEPTGSLDDELRNWFLDLLFQRYRQKPFTILFITHDYSIISEVVNNNPDLRVVTKFDELQDQTGELTLNAFNEQLYLQWISEARKTIKSDIIKQGKCLLTLKSEIKVFDKNISIFNSNNIKVSLKIHENEIVYIKAPSGMGKTSVAKIITGLIRANKFEFSILNKTFNQNTPLKKWKKELWGKLITMTFQHADEALNLNATVKQILMNLPRNKKPKSKDLISSLKLVFDSDLNISFLKKKIHQLSGGQKQRINLLRALLLETPILILDEPLNGLDFISIKKIVDLIIKRRDSGAGILIISHNEEIIDCITGDENIYYLKQN